MNRFIASMAALFMAASCAAFAQADIQIPSGEVQVIDDFENGNYWIWSCSDWDQWGGHKVSAGADLYKKWSSQGKYSLELVMEAVGEGDDASWFYDGSQDLRGGRYIVADFYNPTNSVHEIAVVVQVTDNWNWKESPSFELRPGKHTIVFPVEELNEHFDEVKRITILDEPSIHTSGFTSIFVDNIRLIR